MGSGFHKPGTRSYRVQHGYTSKYERHTSPTYQNSPSPQRSPPPPRRSLTQAEQNENNAASEYARVNAIWNSIERNAIKKKREELIQKNEAKRKANLIKQHNRLAAAAAVNVKNVNKIFKNNKTILGRMRRLAARLSRR